MVALTYAHNSGRAVCDSHAHKPLHSVILREVGLLTSLPYSTSILLNRVGNFILEHCQSVS